MYEIKYADTTCFEYLEINDKHISGSMLLKKIDDKEVIIIKQEEKILGWLRFSFFWDNIPFMNLLMIDEHYRGKGLGRLITEFWEREMKAIGYSIVMTSSLSNETAQHFYRRQGYKDAGCLLLEVVGLEIIFKKEL